MTDTSQGASSGPSTDRHNDPVVDPTRNVLDLVQAAIQRQDDLRAASAQADRDYIDGQIAVLTQRIAAIDRATELRSQEIAAAVDHETMEASLARVNDLVTEKFASIEQRFSDRDTRFLGEILRLGEQMAERFHSIQTQFAERDTRQERESRDNKVAVDAAFAAQKEAAAKQDEGNAKAIDKSEKGTAETIGKLTDLTRAQDEARRQQISDGLRSLTDKIEDLKDGQIADMKTALAELRQVVATGEGRGTGAGEHAAGIHAANAARTQAIAAVAAIFLVLVTLASVAIVLVQAKP